MFFAANQPEKKNQNPSESIFPQLFSPSSRSAKARPWHTRDPQRVELPGPPLGCNSHPHCPSTWRGFPGIVAGVPYRDPPASDLLALHALIFPLSFPFGRLPRTLVTEMKCVSYIGEHIGHNFKPWDGLSLQLCKSNGPNWPFFLGFPQWCSLAEILKTY